MENQTPVRPTRRRPKKTKANLILCFVRRFLLVFFTVIIIAFVGLVLICNLIFNGPSTTARDRLTMSMRESSGMKWCPALFIGEDTVAEIEKITAAELPDELSDYSQIKIDLDNVLSGTDADAKGIERGDILLSVNDTRITTSQELSAALYNCTVGQTVTVIVYRGGYQYELQLTVSEDKG